MQERIASTGPTPCAGAERDRWTGSTREQAWAADRCLDCPALRVCLAYAVVADERGAVWGGLTTAGRHKVPGKTRRTAHNPKEAA